MIYFTRLVIYFICFAISLYALNALDYNRFLKKNSIMKAQILYIIIAMAIAFLMGQFIMGIMYGFRDVQSLM